MSKVRSPEPELFATFWEEIWQPHMRHTDGRGDARNMYRKHVLMGADPQDIVDGARAFIRHHLTLSAQEQKFIPLAASWINKESYSDWAKRERQYQHQLAASQAQNVIPMNKPTPVLPDTHFSVQWAKKKEQAS